jgi:tubulin polyglutamylase TTLL5
MQELHNLRQFDFLPLTLVLPKEMSKLKMFMHSNPRQYWIIKPAGSAQGKGIYITNKFEEIIVSKEQNYVASHYIQNPLLIDGLKFDLRIYVVVTSIYPFRIYVYEEGLTRFATELYQNPDSES